MTWADGNRDKPLALVVDDSEMQCKVLSVLLEEEGYVAISANDGARGVEAYITYQPDLVLMDINMPVMDGYEAARQIKQLSKGTLAPLIFITSMDSEQAFVESIEAGGDGILVRPFSPEVFKAKIKSIQRISDLYSQVKTLQQTMQKDAELAEQLMSGVIESRNFALSKIGIVKKAATLFSGDIQLTAQCPNGDVNVLLGDFTGHGLRSSIGAIPLAETFRVMTEKGFSLFEIVTQINAQLYKLLPSDLFLAAAFVRVSSHENTVYILNAGLPDAYVFNSQSQIKHKIASMHPPLGVVPDMFEETQLEVLSIEATDRVVLISDGIVEARNTHGEMYGEKRFEQSAQNGMKTGNISQTVIKDVEAFCQEVLQEDDISLIDIPCHDWVVKNLYKQNQEMPFVNPAVFDDIETSSIWSWRLKLASSRLARVNPIPLAMTQIQELEGSGEHWQSLYTILTELFINALDHGVLKLDSSLKQSAEGFSEYFKERERRLKELTYGYVELYLSYYPGESSSRMNIQVRDSGQGFKYADYLKSESNKQSNLLCGRGINIVTQLCESLEYRNNGALAEAKYIWN